MNFWEAYHLLKDSTGKSTGRMIRRKCFDNRIDCIMRLDDSWGLYYLDYTVPSISRVELDAEDWEEVLPSKDLFDSLNTFYKKMS